MSQQELLRRVVKELEKLDVEYMLTGSLVSSLQGEPRATHDIDLLVELRPTAVNSLAEAFPPPDFYVSEERARQAVRRKTMFNLIDLKSGGKVDFWSLTDAPFDRSRFSRRRTERLFDVLIQVSSPEDTILMKLRWAQKSGGSAKQYGDALRVYEVQYSALDHDYLEHWVERLELQRIWGRLKREAETL